MADMDVTEQSQMDLDAKSIVSEMGNSWGRGCLKRVGNQLIYGNQEGSGIINLLSEMRRDIGGLQDANTGLKRNMEGLQDANTGLQRNIEGLQDANTGLQRNIEGLQDANTGLQRNIEGLQ